MSNRLLSSICRALGGWKWRTIPVVWMVVCLSGRSSVDRERVMTRLRTGRRPSRRRGAVMPTVGRIRWIDRCLGRRRMW